MDDEYTAKRLQTWAALLMKEGNSLGDSLMDYAKAWISDMDKLARAKAELKQLRVALEAAQHAQPVAYLLGTKSKPDWPYHSRVLVFTDQTTIAGVPAVDDHLARDTGQIHEAVPLYAHPPFAQAVDERPDHGDRGLGSAVATQ